MKKAALNKDSESRLFVWGLYPNLPDGFVLVYTYEGTRKIARETYRLDFARHLWNVLLTKGFHLLPQDVLETLS